MAKNPDLPVIAWPEVTAAIPDMSGSGGEFAARRGKSLLSAAIVGSANRGRVLQALFDLGPTSRAELARQAHVNRTTISGIVQPLLAQQILREGASIPARESGGKPARPLWFSPDAQPICGVLLMPGSVRAGLVSLGGTIEAESERKLPTDPAHRGALLEAMAHCVSDVLAHAARPPLGIGVAVGGMVDTDRRAIVASNLAPALNGFALGPSLEERFSLPVLLDHHPRALLVGDRWFGKGRGLRNFAVIYTGEVLGGALHLDGHLHRGPAGAGGELGHTFVQVDGETCRCGRVGCWDTIATLGWLRREARNAGIPEPESINSARLSQLASADAPCARQLLSLYARNIAIGIANLQQTVAPGVFILHGDAVGGGEPMRQAILDHARRLLPSRPGGDITLETGDGEGRSALLGAAGLVLSELLQFPL